MRVVRELVIVPGDDHRVARVERGEIGIEPVVRVATAIVGEREDLVRRVVAAQRAVGPVAVLVDVVAQVHDGVDVALGDARVRVEEAVRVAGAAREGEADGARAARRSAGATDGRALARRLEREEVRRVGVEALELGLHRGALVGPRDELGAHQLVLERLVARDDQRERLVARCVREVRPHQDAVGRGIEAGDAVAEAAGDGRQRWALGAAAHEPRRADEPRRRHGGATTEHHTHGRSVAALSRSRRRGAGGRASPRPTACSSRGPRRAPACRGSRPRCGVDRRRARRRSAPARAR